MAASKVCGNESRVRLTSFPMGMPIPLTPKSPKPRMRLPSVTTATCKIRRARWHVAITRGSEMKGERTRARTAPAKLYAIVRIALRYPKAPSGKLSVNPQVNLDVIRVTQACAPGTAARGHARAVSTRRGAVRRSEGAPPRALAARVGGLRENGRAKGLTPACQPRQGRMPSRVGPLQLPLCRGQHGAMRGAVSHLLVARVGLARAADGRRVDERRYLLDVVDEHAVKERLIAIEQVLARQAGAARPRCLLRRRECEGTALHCQDPQVPPHVTQRTKGGRCA
eukprot:1447099-Prymnesium_polylepis.1